MKRAISSADRVVLVIGVIQGTGVLISSKHVLTAAHVLRGPRREHVVPPDIAQEPGQDSPQPVDMTGRQPGTAEVIHPASSRSAACDVRWIDPQRDLALLEARNEVVPPTFLKPLGRLRWGRIATAQTVRDCQVIGFPQVQRDPVTGEIECDQYEVTVLPMASRLRPHIMVAEFSRKPATEPAGGASPLAGLSGAPVFAAGVLVGVVTSVPDQRDHMRIEAEYIDEGVAQAFTLPKNERPRTVESVTEFHRNDELFEQEYRKMIKTRFRNISIIGIDELGIHESRWDLDTAYLHLEAEDSRVFRQSGGSPPSPRRVDEQLMAALPRVLLRGEAGAGKTTLVEWIASHTASATLESSLGALNGLIPFVIPLRRLRAHGDSFPGPAELHRVAGLMTGNPPSNWARRVLDAGRGLLLVDGLDEVPQEDREEARQWLSELLSAFPANLCLVTVRPLAVQENWLDHEDFKELHLLPMRDTDIEAFVHAWHDTARLEKSVSAEDQHQLSELEASLKAKFTSNPALRNLARTPLLCAVICALHRRSGGDLPVSRPELYTAALKMLLGKRDVRQKISRPEGIELSPEEHQALLQRIAIWLVRNGQSQLSHEQAVKQLAPALQGMPKVRMQGPPQAILRHILNRSGLLQERTDDSIQFIHRTFQDYLAAAEFRDSDHLSELVRHASQEEWHDVVLLSVGHCTAAEVRAVIEDLMDQGDEHTGHERWNLHVLAASCAAEAVFLPPETRQAVEDRVKAFMPPKNDIQATEVARLGPYVLPMLPGPAGLAEDIQLLVVSTMRRIGTPECLPLALDFAAQPSPLVRQFIVSAWRDFPVERYAREVLARMRLDDLQVLVDRDHMIRNLHHLGPLRDVVISGAFPASQLDRDLPRTDLGNLTVKDNTALSDLSFVVGRPGIKRLRIGEGTWVQDISALEGTDLTMLDLDAMLLAPSEMAVIPRLHRLRELRLWGLGRDMFPPPHPGVARLSVSADGGQLDSLGEWEGLRGLAVWEKMLTGLFSQIRGLPKLRVLQIPVRDPSSEIDPWLVQPGIHSLTLPNLIDNADLTRVVRTFPSLKRITLGPVSEHSTLDLTPLHGLRGLSITLICEGHPGRLTGYEAFAGRLQTKAPSSLRLR
ncbi:NACHT domain-containing protein [Streptomyces lavendulocolor]|uniref:NACHT domain-containing protein n=1 Tax=Streptomyces lavendulocolor TaxID=67316 RepID=UPI003C2BCB4C